MAYFCEEVRGLKKSRNQKNPVVALLFLGYVALMVYLLFVRSRTQVRNVPYWEQVWNNCNFSPSRTIGNYWDVLTRSEYYVEKWGAYAVYRYHARSALVNLLGNVAMFVPLGVFLPAIWPGLRKAWKALPFAMLMIAVIEALQLFTLLGRCDVDDLILNMAGVALGYFLWWLLQFLRHRWK